MGYSSSKEHFSSFHITQLNWTKTRGLKQRVSCHISPLRSALPERAPFPSVLLCLSPSHSEMPPATSICTLPPRILDILCVFYTMVETPPLVGSAFAVSSAVTPWKYDGNGTWVTTWNEMLADSVAGEWILCYPSKKTYVVLFKYKIWEAELIESQSGLKGSVSNHG